MPMMKGDELLIEIHARYPAIIKVLLTGQASAEEVGNVVNQAGLYRFIAKPWIEMDFQLTVAEALRRYRQDQLITQQQQALQEKFHQSQYFIKRITESIPNLLYIFDIAEQSNIYANYATKMLFGYPVEDASRLEFSAFSDNCHPDDRHQFYEGLQRCSHLKNGEFIETEYRVRNTHGQWRWLLSHSTVFLRAEDGTVKQILSSCQDISDRKIVEERLAKELNYSQILENALSKIRDSLSLQEIIDTTVAEVREFLNVDRVVIYESYANGEGLVIAESIAKSTDRELTPLLGILLHDSGFITCIPEYAKGKTQATEDVYLAGLSDCYLEFLIKFQIRANLVVPIIYNHQLLGLISAQNCIAPRAWQEDEITLIKKLANAVAIAMHQAHLYQQIQQSEERLSSVANVSPAVIFTVVTNPEGHLKFEYISAAFVKVHELSIDEALQDFAIIFQQTHPQDLGALQNAIEVSTATMQPFLHAWRIITSTGRTKWLEANAQPVAQENGGITWHGVTVDISDRKEAEALLEMQNRWLSCVALDEPLKPTLELLIELIELQLSDSICSVLLVDDCDRFISYAAPNLPIDFAKSCDGLLIGEGIGSCGTAAFRKELVIVSDIANDPLWENFKGLALAHDLKACWSMPIFSRNREKILGTFGIYHREVRQPSVREIVIIKSAAISSGIAIERHFNEVTIQKQMQQEQFLYRHLQEELRDREQAEADLAASEERFRCAFEDTATGVALISLEGQFIEVNPALCELLGYSETSLLEQYSQNLTFPDDLQHHLKLIEKLISGEDKSFQIEKRYIHQQGHLIWVILSMSLVRNPQKSPLYFVAHLQDITDRHELDRVKDEFISIVSHELRTPLTAIRGALGILHTGVYNTRPEKAQHMLQIALNNSDRLSRLINDILDLEKLESGKVDLVKVPCQISDLIEQAVESVQAIATAAAVELHTVTTFSQIDIVPDMIVQALTNLLSNAIKFSDKDSVVWLRCKLINQESAEQRVLFTVEDQGRGIPSDKLDKIFGRFQQVDISDSRQKSGTGLGLAITKSIIEQHGGQIWVESIFGQGSKFCFTLPIK